MALNTVVTVLGADRTGIIAGVCTTLAANNANIYDIRQTVIDDIFSMTMKVALDEETALLQILPLRFEFAAIISYRP